MWTENMNMLNMKAPTHKFNNCNMDTQVDDGVR